MSVHENNDGYFQATKFLKFVIDSEPSIQPDSIHSFIEENSSDIDASEVIRFLRKEKNVSTERLTDFVTCKYRGLDKAELLRYITGELREEFHSKLIPFMKSDDFKKMDNVIKFYQTDSSVFYSMSIRPFKPPPVEDGKEPQSKRSILEFISTFHIDAMSASSLRASGGIKRYLDFLKVLDRALEYHDSTILKKHSEKIQFSIVRHFNNPEVLVKESDRVISQMDRTPARGTKILEEIKDRYLDYLGDASGEQKLNEKQLAQISVKIGSRYPDFIHSITYKFFTNPSLRFDILSETHRQAMSTYLATYCVSGHSENGKNFLTALLRNPTIVLLPKFNQHIVLFLLHSELFISNQEVVQAFLENSEVPFDQPEYQPLLDAVRKTYENVREISDLVRMRVTSPEEFLLEQEAKAKGDDGYVASVPYAYVLNKDERDYFNQHIRKISAINRAPQLLLDCVHFYLNALKKYKSKGLDLKRKKVNAAMCFVRPLIHTLKWVNEEQFREDLKAKVCDEEILKALKGIVRMRIHKPLMDNITLREFNAAEHVIEKIVSVQEADSEDGIEDDDAIPG